MRHRIKSQIITTILAGIPARVSTKHVGILVFACIERSSWLDPGHDHGDGVTLIIIVEKSFTMTLHAQI
jgi:hypothetical protein